MINTIDYITYDYIIVYILMFDHGIINIMIFINVFH